MSNHKIPFNIPYYSSRGLEYINHSLKYGKISGDGNFTTKCTSFLSRELNESPKVLLVGQPTRGVDIGAIEFIHQRLIDMRDRGAAILLVSVELEEILSLSDRIVVMFDGKIVGEKVNKDVTDRELGLLMAGVA